MPNTHKILLIGGHFSGISKSLKVALENKGCHVIQHPNSLKVLRFRPFYILLMVIHSMLVYKSGWRKFLNRTYAAFLAKSKSAQRIVESYSGIDTVMLIGANSLNYYKKKKPGIHYTVFTDHTNSLSKKLPDYGIKIPERKVYPQWNNLERRILAHQDHIFVMGSQVKRSMIEDYHIVPEKVTVVGGGPNLDLDIERDGFGKNFNARNVLFVGLDSVRKGLHVLREAFNHVSAEYPDAVLNIVGINGKNSDGVVYHGKLFGKPLRDLFYTSQLFVLPTFREPFGIVFLEAMWSKNVCIGTNIGAIPEIIEHGKTGYIIEPGDTGDLAEKIIELFADPGLLEKMAERSYQAAREKWSWDISAQKVLDRL